MLGVDRVRRGDNASEISVVALPEHVESVIAYAARSLGGLTLESAASAPWTTVDE